MDGHAKARTCEDGQGEVQGRRGQVRNPTPFPSVTVLLSIAVCHVSLVWRNYVSVTRFDTSSESGPRCEFLPFYSARLRVLRE